MDFKVSVSGDVWTGSIMRKAQKNSPFTKTVRHEEITGKGAIFVLEDGGDGLQICS